MKFYFHPEAEEELVYAIGYYEECSPGLGTDFSFEVYSAIKQIIAHPDAWTVIEDEIRRILLKRFPFGLLYTKILDEIHILAVMHLRRDPDYWKQRK
jgi:toxin ParE1/3/4